MAASFVVCSAQRVLLPDYNEPTPATVVIDKHSGKIVQVRPGQLTQQELGLPDRDVEWIEAGNNIVLPGLVECVQLRPSDKYLIRDIWYLVPMSILMNQGVQLGRDSGLEPVLQLLEELQP